MKSVRAIVREPGPTRGEINRKQLSSFTDFVGFNRVGLPRVAPIIPLRTRRSGVRLSPGAPLFPSTYKQTEGCRSTTVAETVAGAIHFRGLRQVFIACVVPAKWFRSGAIGTRRANRISDRAHTAEQAKGFGRATPESGSSHTPN